MMQIWRWVQKARGNRRTRRMILLGSVLLFGIVFTYGKLSTRPAITDEEFRLHQSDSARGEQRTESQEEIPRSHSKKRPFLNSRNSDSNFDRDLGSDPSKIASRPLINERKTETAETQEALEKVVEDVVNNLKHKKPFDPNFYKDPRNLPFWVTKIIPEEDRIIWVTKNPKDIPTPPFNLTEHMARDTGFISDNILFQPTTTEPPTPNPTLPPTSPAIKPVRQRGQRCPKTMGKVGIFVVYTNSSVYTHATDVTWCYAISKGYQFYLIQPYEDPLSIERCGHLQQVKYRKHCVAAAYLEKVDWMLISDGDTGVINTDHCLEEYIDPRAEIILYERFFSAEIASGNYFARNTEAARKFIREWADIELEEPPMPYYFSADNGAIHLQVHRTIYPEEKVMHKTCVDKVRLSEWPNWEPGYGAFVRCVKSEMLRYNRTRIGETSPRLLMVPRAQSWVRDARETWYHYYWGDFMAHGIKETEPYNPAMLDRLSMLWEKQVVDECLDSEWQPDMVGAVLVTEQQLREDLRISDEHFSKGALLPIYGNKQMIDCWPHCPPDFITYGPNNYRPPDLQSILQPRNISGVPGQGSQPIRSPQVHPPGN